MLNLSNMLLPLSAHLSLLLPYFLIWNPPLAITTNPSDLVMLDNIPEPLLTLMSGKGMRPELKRGERGYRENKRERGYTTPYLLITVSSACCNPDISPYRESGGGKEWSPQSTSPSSCSVRFAYYLPILFRTDRCLRQK